MRAFLAFFCCLLPFGGAFAADVVTACGDPDYPPFAYVRGWKHDSEPAPGTRIEGVAVDALRMIFADYGIKLEATYQGNWKRCQLNVAAGRTDILLAAYRNDDRQAYATYTAVPLAADPQSAFVWKGREFPFKTWDDLIGKKAGLPLGFSAGRDFDAFLERNRMIDWAPNRELNYKKLEAGRVDFGPDGLYAGLISTLKMGYGGVVVPLPVPINVEYLYVPVSNKSRYLAQLQSINSGLQRLSANGTIDRLIAKHMVQSGYSGTLPKIDVKEKPAMKLETSTDMPK